MEHLISVHSRADLPTPDRESMFKLRYEVFVERLGWDVATVDHQERDHFDELERVSYVLAKAPDGLVDACWRILPTTGPYMLRDTFPELLHGQPAPEADDCWELSRFAVATARTDTNHAAFSPVPVALMVELVAFAKAHGIERYVTVTTPALERMLKRQGVHIHRIGPPIRIGVAIAVACMIELDQITLSALGILSH